MIQRTHSEQSALAPGFLMLPLRSCQRSLSSTCSNTLTDQAVRSPGRGACLVYHKDTTQGQPVLPRPAL